MKRERIVSIYSPANKPFLKAAVAAVGIHKVALLANIATPETDAIFADKVRNMSKDAIQELSKELRQKDFGKSFSEQDFNIQASLDDNYCQSAKQNSAQQGNSLEVSLKCQAKAKTMKIELDEEMTFLFLKFKQKLEKERKQSVSNHEVMKNLLAMPFREHTEEQKKEKQVTKAQKTIESKKCKKILEDFSPHSNNDPQEAKNGQIEQESTSEQKNCTLGEIRPTSVIPQQHKIKVTSQKQKNETPGQLATDTQNKGDLSETNKKISRHIPVAQKIQALEQSNHKCSYPNCNRPPEVFHHPQRFGKTPNHQDLKPLCKPHHEFMHNGLVANEIQITSCWELSLDKNITIQDELYRQYREKALGYGAVVTGS